MTTSSHIPGLEGRPPAPPRRGFTLIEMIVVMTIIGIIVSFILVASRDSIRQAEMRATQALILKLEGGLNDRLDALMQLRPDPNFCHGYLAGIYPGGTDVDTGPAMLPLPILATGYPDTRVRNSARAQAVALADYLKSEMPDVFVVQDGLTSTPGATSYPINFAAVAYPGTPAVSSLGTLANFVLPLGHMVQGPRCDGSKTGWASGYGDSNFTGVLYSSNPQLGLAGRGIYGASYSAAAGIYKNLGYGPKGYDMVDNNGNGLVDEWAEGIDSLPSEQVSDIVTRLRNHTHETARSEMLYALLVEGQGLLGSIFSADDFSDREVQDTDGDGLPEFVDAWGKPLQFYRWPMFYHSEAQRGVHIGTDMPGTSASLSFLRPYNSNFESREQNPLDPNQTLMAPAWWLGTQNTTVPPIFGAGKGTPTNASGTVDAFERLFHPLTEPMAYNISNTTDAGKYWDRGGYTGLGYRRAYFTKPLILSGGPDRQPGVLMLTTPTVSDLITYENNAPQYLPSEVASSGGIPPGPVTTATYPITYQLWDAGQDDVSNHTVNAVAGSGG